MNYLDTSVAVAAVTHEIASGSVQVWLSRQAAGTLAISEWNITEFAAALALKARTGQIDRSTQTAANDFFQMMIEESFVVLRVPSEAFSLAAEFTGRSGVAIRASDSLHLAMASLNGCSLPTLDKAMMRAAEVLGIPVALI